MQVEEGAARPRMGPSAHPEGPTRPAAGRGVRTVRKAPVLRLLLVLVLLTAVGLSRWAFVPMGFHTQLGPGVNWNTQLIREYWPHHLVPPEWIAPGPDLYQQWALTEAAARLGLVTAAWIPLLAVVVIRHAKCYQHWRHPAEPRQSSSALDS